MPHIGNFPPVGYPNPLSIHPSAFLAREDTNDWVIDPFALENRITVAAQVFWAPVSLPHGVTVEKLTLSAFLNTVSDQVTLRLYRNDRVGNENLMAEVIITLTTGWSSASDDTIDYPGIDNENYNYALELTLTPDFAPGDAKLAGAVIDWR